MNPFIERVFLLTAFSTGTSLCLADIVETIESTEPTSYCVAQTEVRGEYESLVINHNMIIPPVDHFKVGDIFVGARLKSQPDALWLLTGVAWRKINNTVDLRNSHYKHFEQLPMVAPVSIFNNPIDLTGVVGDAQIWVGYGLRSVTESAVESFNEMTMSGRYELLWEALPSPYKPASGVGSPYASICFEITAIRKIVHAVGVSVGDVK